MFTVSGQSIEDLRNSINQFLENKNATVGVAIQGTKDTDTLSINGNARLPMQSVFKLTVTKDLVNTYKHLYSPLIKKFPNGTEITIGETIEYSVALSDNLACDLLFEKVGGTEALQEFLHQIGIKEIAIKHTEIVMQSDWEKQYENWTTSQAANLALQIFFENHNLLSDNSYTFLLKILKGTKTGGKSIKGLLPSNTVVAHKTGYSGIKNGLIGAFNNIGIVFLPDGTSFYISILVSDSTESFEESQAIMAQVAKKAWDYFTR